MRHVWVMKEDEYTTAKVVGLETQVGTDHRISSYQDEFVLQSMSD